MPHEWRVEISTKARADFPLPDYVLRDFKILIQDLEEEGFLQGSEPLRGYRDAWKYRFHFDQWRLLYVVYEKSRFINVVRVAPRRVAYRGIKRPT